MSELAQRRTDYAREVCPGAGVRSEALLRAFATVPREDYLGKEPWRILRGNSLAEGYETTPDDDPIHLYQNVLVAVDEDRRLNDGQPSGLAKWIDLLAIGPGDRVLHIGFGVGYYSAILAEVVGPCGRLAAIEIDPALADRARTNLSSYSLERVGTMPERRYLERRLAEVERG